MLRHCLFWVLVMLITVPTITCGADPNPSPSSDKGGNFNSYKSNKGYLNSYRDNYAYTLPYGDGSGYSNSYFYNDRHYSPHANSDLFAYSISEYRIDQLEKELYELRQRKHFKDPFKGLIFVDKKEILAFRVTAGVGQRSYERYVDAKNNDDEDALTLAAIPCGCRTPCDPCDRHFRSRILDTWPTEFFKKVRVTLYKDGEQVVFIDFDPANSTFLDFFRQERIIDSSYPSIATEDVNTFAIEGVGPRPVDIRFRRFAIYNLTNNCDTRAFFIIVADGEEFCLMGDEDFTFPSIYYSKTNTTSIFSNMAVPSNLEELGMADSLTVTVFLKEYGPEHRTCYP